MWKRLGKRNAHILQIWICGLLCLLLCITIPLSLRVRHIHPAMWSFASAFRYVAVALMVRLHIDLDIPGVRRCLKGASTAFHWLTALVTELLQNVCGFEHLCFFSLLVSACMEIKWITYLLAEKIEKSWQSAIEDPFLGISLSIVKYLSVWSGVMRCRDRYLKGF